MKNTVGELRGQVAYCSGSTPVVVVPSRDLLELLEQHGLEVEISRISIDTTDEEGAFTADGSLKVHVGVRAGRAKSTFPPLTGPDYVLSKLRSGAPLQDLIDEADDLVDRAEASKIHSLCAEVFDRARGLANPDGSAEWTVTTKTRELMGSWKWRSGGADGTPTPEIMEVMRSGDLSSLNCVPEQVLFGEVTIRSREGAGISLIIRDNLGTIGVFYVGPPIPLMATGDFVVVSGSSFVRTRNRGQFSLLSSSIRVVERKSVL